MSKYVPTAISYSKEGLVKDKDAFVLSDDAYQRLDNIYQWRGRLKRREGYELLGRLRRDISEASLAAANIQSTYNVADVLTSLRASEPDAEFVPGSIEITIDAAGTPTVCTDNSLGVISQTASATYNLYDIQNITDISNAASAVIDFGAAHQFQVGYKALIQSVVGMPEINDTVVTVSAIGATTMTVNIDSSGFGTYSSGGTANGSFVNYSTAELNITFDSGNPADGSKTVAVDYSYYPSLPCMGIPSRELSNINAEQTVAFDTKYAYVFNNTTSVFGQLGTATWTGSDSDFFYGTNYWRTTDGVGYFWVTNFSGPTGDPMRVYDNTWFNFLPTINGSNELHQARMLIPYKGRLVALNTYEGAALATSVAYPQRARWSQNGAPFSAVAAGVTPTFAQQWRDDVKGRGGYIDCPTSEAIVSAEFVRDVLIVGFESSTWALRYTGNELLPFVWDRINRELGSESTFGTVVFDQGVVSVGDKSINSCDGNSVKRIDEKIPDEVFQIHNTFDSSTEVSDAPKRVHGVRNFFERVVYWTFPDAATAAKFPDRVLVYNYDAGSWALFSDSFTAYGSYQRFNDVRWQDLIDLDWRDADFSWVTARLQSQFPSIIAGNQQGFILNLNKKVSNEESLAINAVTGGANPVILNVTEHNLQSDEFIKIDGIFGTGNLELNGRVFKVVRTGTDTMTLQTRPRFDISAITQASQGVVTANGHSFQAGDHFYIDAITAGMTEISGLNGMVVGVSGNAITIDIDTTDFTAYTAGGAIQNLDGPDIDVFVDSRTYMGKGTVTRVMGFSAVSKKFNIIDKGKKTTLGYIDFLTEVTQDGEIGVDLYIDYADDEKINNGDDGFYNTQISTQVEQFSTAGKSKEWHRFYAPIDSQFFQYDLTLSDRQMYTPAITDSEVLVDAIILYATASGRLVE